MKKLGEIFAIYRCFYLLYAFIALQMTITTLANSYYPICSFIGLFAFGSWVQYAEENHLTRKNRMFFRLVISLSLLLTSIFFLGMNQKSIRDIVFLLVLLGIHLLEFLATIIEEN